MTAINDIYHSYADTNKQFVTPSGTGKPIKYGDRILARLVLHGRIVVEFMISRVNDLTELLGELRHLTRGLKGLAKLYVRNFSRGWSMERPMMLYPDLHRPESREPQYGSYYQENRGQSRGGLFGSDDREMLCPWETH